MKKLEDSLLPGIPVELVKAEISNTPGNELESGKFFSANSSAALAVNTFGWFLNRACELPPLPGMGLSNWYPIEISLERVMRFPWGGDRGHPCLDAAIETPEALIGVESKRFEPFRDRKSVAFSDAYNRDVWGPHMEPFERMRDSLKSGVAIFHYLDAAQLVKHAFGLVTECVRVNKKPILYYLYAEPTMVGKKVISAETIRRHRDEVQLFGKLIAGARVGFASSSYREWLSTWPSSATEHAARLISKFEP